MKIGALSLASTTVTLTVMFEDKGGDPLSVATRVKFTRDCSSLSSPRRKEIFPEKKPRKMHLNHDYNFTKNNISVTMMSKVIYHIDGNERVDGGGGGRR